MFAASKIIDFWYNKFAFLKLVDAVTILRYLGDFERDGVTIIGSGYRRVPMRDLWHWYDREEYCSNIGPLYFEGGPFGSRNFKGTLLTVILDRVLLVANEKGAKHVLKVVEYVTG